MISSPFQFKKFKVEQVGASHAIGTDAVLLGAWADVAGAQRMLDIGTGTGVVALMLAQRVHPAPASQIIALDIHPPSAALAQINFDASPWAACLQSVEISVQDYAQSADRPFDLIVSNPPFFSDRTVSPDPVRRLGRHTATLPPQDLLEAVGRLLALHGRFCVVLPAPEAQRLCELAVPMGLYWTKITRVRSRPEKPVERWLIQLERDPYPFEQTEMLIYAQAEQHSIDFQNLTRDFYLRTAGRGHDA